MASTAIQGSGKVYRKEDISGKVEAANNLEPCVFIPAMDNRTSQTCDENFASPESVRFHID